MVVNLFFLASSNYSYNDKKLIVHGVCVFLPKLRNVKSIQLEVSLLSADTHEISFCRLTPASVPSQNVTYTDTE